jgi:uncharacterized SAM-binding protein YcdF (DUF218 family)
VGLLAGFLARDLRLALLVSYWGDPTPIVLGCAALGALLWWGPLRIILAGGTAALVVLWIVVALTPLVRWLGADLVRADVLPARADAVFVLASKMQDDGEPTSVAMSRLLQGLELVAEGRAPRLVLSELPQPYQPYAPWARHVMRRLGLEQELLTVGPVRRTADEAAAVAALFRERGWSRLVLVTSPSHTRRAGAVFEHAGLDVYVSPSLETGFDSPDLPTPDGRLAAFGSVMHERLGLIYYARRGWIDPKEGGLFLGPVGR